MINSKLSVSAVAELTIKSTFCTVWLNLRALSILGFLVKSPGRSRNQSPFRQTKEWLYLSYFILNYISTNNACRKMSACFLPLAVGQAWDSGRASVSVQCSCHHHQYGGNCHLLRGRRGQSCSVQPFTPATPGEEERALLLKGNNNYIYVQPTSLRNELTSSLGAPRTSSSLIHLFSWW